MTARILVLSRYSRLGASSRLRTRQYECWLQGAGFEVEFSSFFDDEYLNCLYAGKTSKIKNFKYFYQRIKKIIAEPKPDIIWLEYELFPWIPWFLESIVLPLNIKIVCDYDDAIFHRYDQNRSMTIRKLLGNKIDKLMATANLVTVGNEYLAQRADCSKKGHVEIVPTVVDTSQYKSREKEDFLTSKTVGWIGTPNTWKTYGERRYKYLIETLTKKNALFKAVGAKMHSEKKGNLEIVPWHESTEVDAIRTMDIGVMPLDDSLWSRGKCGYKLIQYMACGVPVVASPVGVNRIIVDDGINGFLVSSAREWEEAILILLNNPTLAHEMGQAGRKKIQDEYSLDVWGPRVVKLFQSLLLEKSC